MYFALENSSVGDSFKRKSYLNRVVVKNLVSLTDFEGFSAAGSSATTFLDKWLLCVYCVDVI